MRRLATALACRTVATYWHSVAAALLEAMAETLITGHGGARRRLAWDERITELAHRLRRALLSRRDAARLFSAAFFPLPNALAYGEAMTRPSARAV